MMKLRIVRQLRTPEYDQLFAGDPTWVSALLFGFYKNAAALCTRVHPAVCRRPALGE